MRRIFRRRIALADRDVAEAVAVDEEMRLPEITQIVVLVGVVVVRSEIDVVRRIDFGRDDDLEAGGQVVIHAALSAELQPRSGPVIVGNERLVVRPLPGVEDHRIDATPEGQLHTADIGREAGGIRLHRLDLALLIRDARLELADPVVERLCMSRRRVGQGETEDRQNFGHRCMFHNLKDKA
ncbi:hypothetical protein [uncultured Jannaschia sp.]|uniref:hypothetical protein n=1 Tax=uncultured Jannaschia sp. TaxID=293347 RepID=UPI00260BC30A|nr:hypothetical protein [uncultured Jannaschia sp.]